MNRTTCQTKQFTINVILFQQNLLTQFQHPGQNQYGLPVQRKSEILPQGGNFEIQPVDLIQFSTKK